MSTGEGERLYLRTAHFLALLYKWCLEHEPGWWVLG